MSFLPLVTEPPHRFQQESYFDLQVVNGKICLVETIPDIVVRHVWEFTKNGSWVLWFNAVDEEASDHNWLINWNIYYWDLVKEEALCEVGNTFFWFNPRTGSRRVLEIEGSLRSFATVKVCKESLVYPKSAN